MNVHRPAGTRRLSGESGQVAVLFALGITALLGILALVVDVGSAYIDRRNLRNSADAAALAGAAYLPDNPSQATAKAREWALKNGVAESEIQTIEIRTSRAPNDTMYVGLKKDHAWVFARVLGMTTSEVSAGSAAMKGSPVGMNGLMPWAVTNDIFLGLNPGQTATLKYDSQNVESGNFQPIGLDGSGAQTYRETIREGSESMLCVVGQERPDCPSIVSTETGNMVGPTRDGLQWLKQNTPAACDSFGEVFSNDATDPGKYVLSAQCNPFSTSQPGTSVAIVPVIDSLCNGSCDVQVLRFAMFFVEGFQCGGQGQGSSCNVTGRYAETAVDINALIGPYDPLGSVSFVRLIE